MKAHISKVRFLLVLVLSDMILTTLLRFETSKHMYIPLTVIEAVLHLVTLFVVFLFLFDTFLFSHGLLGGLFNETITFIVMFPIYFVGSIAFNAWTIALNGKHWTNDLYLFTFIPFCVIASLYYASCFVTALNMGHTKLYSEQEWFKDSES